MNACLDDLTCNLQKNHLRRHQAMGSRVGQARLHRPGSARQRNRGGHGLHERVGPQNPTVGQAGEKENVESSGITGLQGLLTKLQIFSFACHISNYEIADSDMRKCSRSFFMFARQLSSIREGIKEKSQRKEFDLEVRENLSSVTVMMTMRVRLNRAPPGFPPSTRR